MYTSLEYFLNRGIYFNRSLLYKNNLLLCIRSLTNLYDFRLSREKVLFLTFQMIEKMRNLNNLRKVACQKVCSKN